MEIIITNSDTLPANISTAIVYGANEKIAHLLSSEELDFLEKRDVKAESCLLQRVPNFVYLAKVNDENRPEYVSEKFRKAGAAWMEIVKREKISEVAIAGFGEPEQTLCFLEGFMLAGYAFQKYKKEKDFAGPVKVILVDNRIKPESVWELKIVADAVCWARDLVNEPQSALNAMELSQRVLEKSKTAGFEVEIFHKQKIESLKMGGLLAVNKGSIEPPTFSILEWKPENAVNEKPIVLVGKGIVYDTGGLSLKPTPKSMDYMKCDMAGAAAVAGVLCAVSEARLPVHIVGLIPATDNRPDGNAYAPGDIIAMFDNTTVEVMNTDAEGRLILADALSYAKKYNPQLVIDLATLTGATDYISGRHGMVAMGNCPEQLEKLKKSGDRVFERMVELPLWEEYAAMLKSEIADMTNLGGREGQTIVAGKFLEHFTGYPWIHLDIAATAWLFEKDAYRPAGGTGNGIRLLFDFLKNF